MLGPSLGEQALGSVEDLLEGKSAGQRDLEGLEERADRHLVKFKDEEDEVPHLGQSNPVQQDGQQLWREGPGGPGDGLGVSRATPTGHVVGHAGRSTTSTASDGVLHLSSAPKTHLGLGSGLGPTSTTQ